METESEEIRQERIRLTLEKQKQNHDLEKPMAEELQEGQKICPFRSTPEKPVICDESCKLYRSDKKKGYECYFMELQSLTWLITQLMELFKGKKPRM